ncbi:hypothetical protein [Gordonia sputi]
MSSSVVITGAAGTATVSNPAPYMQVLWDPCSLPASVTGRFQGKYEKPDKDDSMPSQRSCGYGKTAFSRTEVGYNIDIIVSAFPFDESKQNRVLENVVPSTVGDGHPAAVADLRTDPGGRALLWGTSYGTVLVKVYPLPWNDQFDAQAMLDRFVSLAYPYVAK